MTLHDNAYAAFMLDYVAGSLSPAERLAGDVHRAISPAGSRTARMLEAAGGMLLEGMAGQPVGTSASVVVARRGQDEAPVQPGDNRLAPYLEPGLLDLPWRRSLFGVQTRPTGVPMASLLRLDPGDHAPSHGHGRRDVTVVLLGSFADEYGVYERGDLAFAEPGLKHAPRAVGDSPCVCLIATEAGRPLSGFFGLFGWVGAKSREAA
jgi:predicted ChrR family anti-sigma factor